MKLKTTHNTSQTAYAFYSELDSSYMYECPICGEIQEMSDLTEREEANFKKGNSVYYECDFCEAITEVTCED